MKNLNLSGIGAIIPRHSKSEVKHGVTPEEIESVFDLKMAIPLGRQALPEVEKERLCIIGPDSCGRMLSVVFTRKAGCAP